MPWVWLAVAVAFGVLEVATVAFFAAFLSVGALAAALAGLLGASLLLQLLVFVAVSLVGVVVLRPHAMRRLQRHGSRLVSGAPALVGRRAVAVDAIGDSLHPGHVLIGGERWLAVTGSGIEIANGTPVVVIEIQQSTLVVAPV